MIMTWGFLWPWPQTLRGKEGEEEGKKSSSNSSAFGKKLNKKEEIKGRIELLSHNVEMDRMFNRG